MANVYLGRHGDAVDTKGKFHGMKDVPLTTKGVEEARKLAQSFIDLKIPFKKIVASPLSRTADTAEIVSEATGLPVEYCKELLPLDLGAYVGKSTGTYQDDVRYYLQHPDERIPNGGTVNEWAKPYINYANKDLFDGTDDNIIYITHGRNILLTKADIKLGNNLNYDNLWLADNNTSTEHGGYAIANGDEKRFEIINPKKTV